MAEGDRDQDREGGAVDRFDPLLGNGLAHARSRLIVEFIAMSLLLRKFTRYASVVVETDPLARIAFP